MAKRYSEQEAARLRGSTGTSSSPDGKPPARPLTTRDLESIAEITSAVIKQAVDREVAARIAPLSKQVAALEQELGEMRWELDRFRERSGAPPIRRTFERVVGASYDSAGRVVGMTKEILNDE